VRHRKRDLSAPVKSDLTLRFTAQGLTSHSGLELFRRFLGHIRFSSRLRNHLRRNDPAGDFSSVSLVRLILVMLVVGGSGWVLYELTERSLEGQMRQHLVSVARLLSTGLYGDVLRRLRPGDESSSLYRRLTEKLRQSKEVIGATRIYVIRSVR